MNKLTPEAFNELLKEKEIALSGINEETVYDTYYTKIYPYLSLIGDFMARENPATEKQLRRALGVGSRTWSECVKIFDEFEDMLSCKESFMNLKVELDLERGIQNTEYKQPKLQEMRQQLYNKEMYRPKEDDEGSNIPTTIEVRIVDASVDEETLEED